MKIASNIIKNLTLTSKMF